MGWTKVVLDIGYSMGLAAGVVGGIHRMYPLAVAGFVVALVAIGLEALTTYLKKHNRGA